VSTVVKRHFIRHLDLVYYPASSFGMHHLPSHFHDDLWKMVLGNHHHTAAILNISLDQALPDSLIRTRPDSKGKHFALDVRHKDR